MPKTLYEIKKNKLTVIIEDLRWLSLQACALRGHDESPNSRNRGNLNEMIKPMSRLNADSSNNVLKNAPGNAMYIYFPKSIKIILHILASKVWKKIRYEVGDSKFSILVDEAKDEIGK